MYIATEKIAEWIQRDKPDAVLDLQFLNLSELPPIPQNCHYLNCSHNRLTKLPEFPDIIKLRCSYNKLTSLPPLPKCKVLYCQANGLSKLPELPKCSDLWCSDNQLEELPDLPNCTDLWCDINKLTSLPELPLCHDLQCHNNELKKLPNCTYKKLLCSYNQLEALPELPQCILLECSHNKLTYLPDLPKVESILCESNYIKYLPTIRTGCNIYTLHTIKYIYINKKQALTYHINSTPNYHKHIKVIQRTFKKYLHRRYQSVVSNYLFAGPTKIVCLYLIF